MSLLNRSLTAAPFSSFAVFLPGCKLKSNQECTLIAARRQQSKGGLDAGLPTLATYGTATG